MPAGQNTPGLMHAPLLLLQVTSHAHELVQSTSRHEPRPVHDAVHLPVPQVTFSQAREPEQVRVHDFALAQLMPLRHSSLTVHLMTQFQSVGQVSGRLQSAPPAQSILHVIDPTSHDEQASGHLSASITGLPSIVIIASISPPGTTHSPLMHCRPSEQSDGLLHANWSLRWLIEQLVTMANIAATTTTLASTTFTGRRRS
jgi:hypothetical protein